MKKIMLITGLIFNAGWLFSQSIGENNNRSVPELTSEQRLSIANPQNGLLVFDLTANSFWLFNSRLNLWEELPNHISANEENKNIDSSYLFDDLRVPVTATKLYGSKEPTFDLFVENGQNSHGVFTFWFDSESEEELYFTVQMPHSWKEGTDLFPHVHWVSMKDLNGTKVRWSLEYSWANVGDIFPNTQIISNNNIINFIKGFNANQHFVTNLGVLEGEGKEISSMLICRIYRDAEAADDTYIDEAGLLQIDFHFELDVFGSHELFKK